MDKILSKVIKQVDSNLLNLAFYYYALALLINFQTIQSLRLNSKHFNGYGIYNSREWTEDSGSKPRAGRKAIKLDQTDLIIFKNLHVKRRNEVNDIHSYVKEVVG